jgi:hypothetical protein
MLLTSPQRRKLNDELPSSWRSISCRAFCEQRSELYWEALRTGSKVTWAKYDELTKKFVRLHGRKTEGEGNGENR